ncbi:multicopper oxidase domain-containing protein [Halocola ammonii]
MTMRFSGFLLIVLAILTSQAAKAADVTLYINKGTVTIDENSFSACSFNTIDTLNSANSIIELEMGEILNLTVINHDTLDHNLTIDGILESDNIVAAGGEASFSFSFENPGTWRYYSDFSYGKLAGASGIILVGYSEMPHFFWNLFDLNKSLSTELANTTTSEIPADYQPELFMINGTYYPYTLEDPSGKVDVDLGQEVIISVVNSGVMDHVLHFHGFHIEILSAQIQSDRVGWIKDTVPLKSGEAMTFKLVADQEGVYPVHDHNLIAVTNTGFYPGGMLTQIQVNP